jgi:small nuclear ribonucleoprotein (snRNP)-like protein
MLFFSFFKTLVGKEVAVELKNDVVVTGTLVSVDQYLNVKLTNVNVVDTERYPQLVRFCVCVSHCTAFSFSLHDAPFARLFRMLPCHLQAAMKNAFIRGSVVRYIQIPAAEVDTDLLQDAARKENSTQR